MQDSKIHPTNINAYKAELSEKEAQHSALSGEIETLKETISTMEAGTAETPINDNAEVERLEELKRDELEKEAERAGIENPDDKKEFPNKATLAEATAEAQGSGEQSDDGSADDDTTPLTPAGEGEEPVDPTPSQPIVNTPEGSDVPPASSEVPTRIAEEENPDAQSVPAGNDEVPEGDERTPDVTPRP